VRQRNPTPDIYEQGESSNCDVMISGCGSCRISSRIGGSNVLAQEVITRMSKNEFGGKLY